MEPRRFGPIRFISGENRGKYPYCHSLFIEGAGILIDPASDRKRLKRLRSESNVKAVWLSHWHEDHFMHLDLFEDLPLWISKEDAPQLANVELFLDGYGIENTEIRHLWREIVTSQFNFRPRTPVGYLKGGREIRLDTVTVDVIHTPGHTPGHLCFFFREPSVLFLGDYDLTPFGPWYGDRDSSISQTISSIERLKNIPAKIWITCHEKGIFEEPPGDLWDDYVKVIKQRENKLLDFLNTPRTMLEIVDKWIVYQRPREPKEFYAFAEQMIMQKHIELLASKSVVARDGERYYRLK